MATTTTIYQENLQHSVQDHNGIVDQTPYMSTFFCKALYDYQSKDASSLSFHRGDVIEVLTQLDSGWWDGLLHDERGWFPSNYVAPMSVQEMEDELRVAEQQQQMWTTNEPVEPTGPSSDFWMPEVSSDGRIFYVNTQTGERSTELPLDGDVETDQLISAYMSPTTPSTNTARYTITPGSVQSQLAGFGIPKRSGTPEPWVKRLADDGMSYYYLNTIDKSISWTPPSPQTHRPSNTILDPVASTTVFRPVESSVNDDRISVYSDNSDDNPLGILGRVAHNHSETAEASMTPSQLGEDAVDIVQARELQTILQDQFAPPPESLSDLAQTVKHAVKDLVDSALSRSGGTVIKEGIRRTTDSIRDLVYASSTLQGSLSSLPPPYNSSSLFADISELKQYHRKFSTTMVKLISTVRASDMEGVSDEDLTVRIEADASDLERAMGNFVDEVLRRRSPFDESRRVRAVLNSTDGSKGIGLSLYGAGAAARWKGFGFVDPFEGEILGPKIISTVKQHSAELDKALGELGELGDIEQAIVLGQEVVRKIVLFLALISDVNVARSIDVDSTSVTVVDPPYVQSVTRARALVRALEADMQAMFDDGAALLSCIQSAVYNPDMQHHPWAHVLPTLRNYTGNVAATLEELVEIASYQDDACAKAGEERAIGLRDARIKAHIFGQRDTLRPDDLMNYEMPSPNDGELVDLSNAFVARPPTRDHERVYGFPRHERSDTSINGVYDEVKVDHRSRINGQTGSIESLENITAVSQVTSTSQGETLVFQRTPPPEEYDSDDEISTMGVRSPPRAAKIKQIFGADAPEAYIRMANVDSKPWYLRAEFGAKDIFINPDGNVRGGTLPALIERLTMHDNRDANFINTFLITLKSFTTLDDVFDSLVKRFNIQPPEGLAAEELKEWTEQKQVVVRLRVINIFKSLVIDDNVLEKEDFHILDRIKAFSSEAEKEIVPPIPAIKQLMVLIERAQSGGGDMIKRTINTSSIPPPSLMPKSSKPMKLLDINPIELARQLTIMESKLFAKIRPIECLIRGRDGKPGDSDDNISSIIDTSNKVAEWVADAVLSKDDSRKRAAIIKQFIAVADQCRNLQNFSTMAALVAGLNSPPIRRLKRTWEQVNARSKAQLQEAERTMDTNKNFTNYRAILKQAQLPCVPFFGVYLSVLTFIQDGNKNMIQGDIINFSKREKFAEVIREIKHYQSKPYILNVIQSVQAFIDESLSALGNTADLSDRAWNLSLEREPREREDEKMARLLQESGFL